jgi:hypothetical protein
MVYYRMNRTDIGLLANKVLVPNSLLNSQNKLRNHTIMVIAVRIVVKMKAATKVNLSAPGL